MSLTAAQLVQFKNQLQARRRELKAFIQSELVDAGHGQLANQVHDSGEESFADLLIGIDMTVAHIDLQEVRDIDEALLRIDEGRYGVCIDCGVTIPEARLQAQPSAARCVNCQSSFEELA